MVDVDKNWITEFFLFEVSHISHTLKLPFQVVLGHFIIYQLNLKLITDMEVLFWRGKQHGIIKFKKTKGECDGDSRIQIFRPS